MAKGLNEFTVQEATNFEAFSEWNYETKAFDDANYKDYTYVTSLNPAKKIVIYQTAADAAFDSGETITIKLNGNTDAGKEIVIDSGDLPFTLSGLSINSISIKTSDDTTTNDLSVLSFH
tara:strand:+ start:2847 stop:3203 length:357 start_codon:yes stop_codon:yes gene_type:complete